MMHSGNHNNNKNSILLSLNDVKKSLKNHIHNDGPRDYYKEEKRDDSDERSNKNNNNKHHSPMRGTLLMTNIARAVSPGSLKNTITQSIHNQKIMTKEAKSDKGGNDEPSFHNDGDVRLLFSKYYGAAHQNNNTTDSFSKLQCRSSFDDDEPYANIVGFLEKDSRKQQEKKRVSDPSLQQVKSNKDKNGVNCDDSSIDNDNCDYNTQTKDNEGNNSNNVEGCGDTCKLLERPAELIHNFIVNSPSAAQRCRAALSKSRLLSSSSTSETTLSLSSSSLSSSSDDDGESEDFTDKQAEDRNSAKCNNNDDEKECQERDPKSSSSSDDGESKDFTEKADCNAQRNTDNEKESRRDPKDVAAGTLLNNLLRVAQEQEERVMKKAAMLSPKTRASIITTLMGNNASSSSNSNNNTHSNDNNNSSQQNQGENNGNNNGCNDGDENNKNNADKNNDNNNDDDGNNNNPDEDTITKPFHERQSLLNQLCLMHAINMLLAEEGTDENSTPITQQDLDEVCEILAPKTNALDINPHRSILGLGNYDINVAMYLLQQRNLSVTWFDGRKTVHELMSATTSNDNQDKDSFPSFVGYLINIPSMEWMPGWVPVLGQTRHWITIKPTITTTTTTTAAAGDYLRDSQWWQLDSRLKEPLLLENIMDMMSQHLEKGSHIFIVRKDEVVTERT